MGELVSTLLRDALCGNDVEIRDAPARFGFRPFAKPTGIVTNDIINRLRDEAGD